MAQTAQFSDLLRQAFKALDSGDPEKAAQFCRPLLALEPERPEGHFLVGLVATELKDPVNAQRGFGSATKCDPNFGAAWAHMAQFHAKRGNLAKAEKALEGAVAASYHDAMSQGLVGTVAAQLGSYDLAVIWFQKAQEQAPDSDMHRINYANALVYLGDLEQALSVLGAHEDADTGNPHAQWILSSARKASSRLRPDQMMDRAKGDIDAPSRAFLGYAAGKEFEDLQAWTSAYEAFALGARAKRSMLDYDDAEDQKRFDGLQRTFDEHWFKTRQDRGFHDPSPIFVVGQPRTGTTLIERIITSHSQVTSAGELQIFGSSIQRMIGDSHPSLWSTEALKAASELDMARLGQLYLERCQSVRGSTPFFVDKLPRNFLYVGLILAALPNAKIVNLVRDPRDVLWSNYKQLFAEAYPHSYDPMEMARHYVRYHKLMDHWRALAPGRVYDISYEDTVLALEPSARGLISALDLEWEEACLKFYEQKGAVATASAVQVRQKAHTGSVARWRHYEDQLRPAIDYLSQEGVL